MAESSQDIPLAQYVAAGPRAVPLQPLPSFGSEVRQLARLLYNHNPFYVVSALLVFSGLWQSFTREAALVEAGAIAPGTGRIRSAIGADCLVDHSSRTRVGRREACSC